MDEELIQGLPDAVLFRIARGDAKGRPFGTPRNPRTPTREEFNPRLAEVRLGDLAKIIVSRRHGIFLAQARRISQWSNEDLLAFRREDPISAIQVSDGLALTGGHHRIHEIIQRVLAGRLPPDTVIRILLHD